MDNWLVESFIDENAVQPIDEDALLEASDPKRKAVLSSSCAVVKRFFRDNGVQIETSKAFRNIGFKKGKTNQMVFSFSADALTRAAVFLLFGGLIEIIYNIVVTNRDMPRIKQILSDPKKKAELNKMLKDQVEGTVTIKEFRPSNHVIVLEYKE